MDAVDVGDDVVNDGVKRNCQAQLKPKDKHPNASRNDRHTDMTHSYLRLHPGDTDMLAQKVTEMSHHTSAHRPDDEAARVDQAVLTTTTTTTTTKTERLGRVNQPTS
jgi:hypothetical protein